MRRVKNFLDHNKIKSGKDIVTYPFSMLIPVWDNPDLMTFRIMVDGELGDDINDGLTWDTALKTPQVAIDRLPKDLKGAHAIIFVHPGTYPDFSSDGFTNGRIRLITPLTYVNKSSGNPDPNGYYEYLRNGKDDPIRNDNGVVYQCTDGCFMGGLDSSFYFSVDSQDFNYGPFDDGFGVWDKITFEAAPGKYPWKLLALSNLTASFESHITFNVDRCSFAGLEALANLGGFFHGGLTFNGGPEGDVSNSTSPWRGCIWLEANLFNGLDIEAPSTHYKVGFEPPDNVRFYATGIRNFLAGGAGMYTAKNVVIKIPQLVYSQGHLPDADHPILNIGNLFTASSISYRSVDFRVTDNSIQPHVIEELDTGKVTSFFAPHLKSIADDMIIGMNTSAPMLDNLDKDSFAFWFDETNKRLKIALKDGAGGTWNGDIAIQSD